MGDTKKDKEKKEENELTKSKEKDIKRVPLHITFGNFLLAILVVLIVGTGSLVYYMIYTANKVAESSSQTVAITNTVKEEEEAEEDENVDTIMNMIDSALSSNTVEDNTSSTVNAVDANSRKVMNESLIVLYNGLVLDTTSMGQKELEYIDNSDTYKDKYVITYYNYENYSYVNSSLGSLSSQVYDGLVKVDNVSKIAISESYEAIPREIKIVNAIPTAVSEKNSKLDEYDSIKVIITDLDGNSTDEYILILANKTSGYSKIMLADSTGESVADLAYIEKDDWASDTTEDYSLSLSNVEVIDVDNDGIMEILVEIPKYEGDPSISIVKYKNGELTGDTDIECSLLP